MFMNSVRGGKAIGAEQKIRELKSTIAKINALKMKVIPTTITASSENMKSVLNEKDGLSPNEIEKSIYQAKGSEHYLLFLELSESINYMTDWLGKIRKNTEQKEIYCEEILILTKKF